MVVKPVMFAVISTMIFFAPMWFVPGDMADVAKSIPTVVTLALAFSLIECMILLAHRPYAPGEARPQRLAGWPGAGSRAGQMPW